MIRWFALAVATAGVVAGQSLPAGLEFERGAVNSVMVGGTAVYAGRVGRTVERLLLTHARRDAMGEAGAGAEVVVPAAERELFEAPGRFWEALETERFHDYAQLGTKAPVRAVKVARGVAEGDRWEERGAVIRVVATPGYTRGAVTYVIEAGGKKAACTGDLIYGDGQLFDLYSLQDAVAEAKARGYHGYAARAGELIASLRKVKAERPDVILPARGPAIADPGVAIDRLIDRLQRFLASHYEVDALRWYWGDENHGVRSRAVERRLDVMAMAEQRELPESIVAIGNSRLLVSRTGRAFLVDAGYKPLLEELKKLRAAGRIRGVDGIWITHYHDDHTDYVNDVVAEFGAKVYFTAGMAEVMEKPGWFRLPCLTTRGVTAKDARRDGETMRWQEWDLTFWHFPGQTLYHGGLVARQDGGETYLFAGDSFTPSGMDDYCMQNRVILREGEGYEQCLRRMASLPRGAWVLNQHVRPMFRYTEEQLERMRGELRERMAVLGELSPWPEINYMVDESWARVHPYGVEAAAGAEVELELRVMNHAAEEMEYRVRWHVPEGFRMVKGEERVKVGARREGRVKARVKVGAAGLHVVTADVGFGGWELREWTEGLVRVR